MWMCPSADEHRKRQRLEISWLRLASLRVTLSRPWQATSYAIVVEHLQAILRGGLRICLRKIHVQGCRTGDWKPQIGMSCNARHSIHSVFHFALFPACFIFASRQLNLSPIGKSKGSALFQPFCARINAHCVWIGASKSSRQQSCVASWTVRITRLI